MQPSIGFAIQLCVVAVRVAPIRLRKITRDKGPGDQRGGDVRQAAHSWRRKFAVRRTHQCYHPLDEAPELICSRSKQVTIRI